MSSTYLGKVCAKHPGLNGLRMASGSVCVDCKKDRMKLWREKNTDKVKTSRSDFHAAKKLAVISEYGGCCDLCGENDIDVLTIDHLWGRGAEHRKEVPASRLTQWLIDEKFPRGFRVLCFNCNFKSHLHLKRTGGPLATLKTLQKEVTRWADRLFPRRDSDEIIRKLQEESQELLDDTFGPDEYADVLILVLDLASQHGIDVEKAVLDKMEVNEGRKWKKDSVAGVMRHV